MRRAQCDAPLLRFAFLVCRRRTKLPWERALCQVGRRTRFLNCERFERRYDARNDGFFASRRWRKCAQSNRVAASAVSVSALRRELPRSHKHRVCDAWNERRPRPDRFGLRHGEWNFFYWIFCAANSRGAAGRTLEREAATRAYTDHLGRADDTHRVCPYSASALRRAIFTGRGRSGIFSRRNRLSIALVHLSGPRQSDCTFYVGDSDRLYSRRTARWRDPRDQLVGNTWLALVVFARRCAGGSAWNRHAIRTARSPNRGAVACA